ncbi:MAG: DUF2867 domain-containing protein [Bacteroidetes bacterium HGW-Bacteroidetes-10]|nr:MAG: DUF2867 domain-containing protein [Bacteroidetes bacterium HGW-Bacteroidetes-10]
MKILLTGANGYIGKRLLPSLLAQGHEIVCCVRDRNRFRAEGILSHPSVSVIEADFLRGVEIYDSIKDIDAAYYLIHSMSTNKGSFTEMEALSARNFVSFIEGTGAKQIVYLSGIVNEERLSQHLASRKNVEDILSKSSVPLTTLRAGIIVGSGSASFEIIRDLVEKLPVMVAPKWLNTRTQPISVRNVIEFLTGVLNKPETYGHSYDIGGPDILTYKDMLLGFGRERGLKRYILTVPVMTPKLSSYWLYFITSTSFSLASNLVNSMKIEVVARKNNLAKLLGITLTPYSEAVAEALRVIEQDEVPSSWKDSLVSSYNDNSLFSNVNVPENGVLTDERVREIKGSSRIVLSNIWSIGGDRGWYFGNFLWRIRGLIDKMAGGVGLRRGRTNRLAINAGDTLDFWRVLVADKPGRRLLLFAEMKLPGEAWLEFRITSIDGKEFLFQKATFRPKGLSGRAYWYILLPVHLIMFGGMAGKIINFGQNLKQ